ncbi:helix-turn-helix transcriptional regulator [Nocardia sp. NPDC127606]|uniref:helix-turn-helix transcriptional regulator n=1 Tax=Nocardia sp. NPDC127606 TaxID=3345406 RepID=UPI0036323652
MPEQARLSFSSWQIVPLHRYDLDMRQGDDKVRVGATIKALRNARGLSGASLAQSVGISSGHLTNIEAGRRACLLPLARRIAQSLNVDVKAITTTTELLGARESDPASPPRPQKRSPSPRRTLGRGIRFEPGSPRVW